MSTPAPTLGSITIRQAGNGFILNASFQQAPGMLLPAPNEYIFSTFADLQTWLKTQGWTV